MGEVTASQTDSASQNSTPFPSSVCYYRGILNNDHSQVIRNAGLRTSYVAINLFRKKEREYLNLSFFLFLTEGDGFDYHHRAKTCLLQYLRTPSTFSSHYSLRFAIRSRTAADAAKTNSLFVEGQGNDS